jgi:Fe-S-cluster containining protein
MSFNYPTAVRFQCTKCGICCGDTKQKTRHILLLKTEAEHIATTTSQPTSTFTIRIKDKAPYNYEMKKTKEGKCIFLKNNDGKHTFLYTSECPGINKGPILSKNYFRKLLRIARAQIADPKKSN